MKPKLKFCLKCDGLRDDNDVCIFCGFDNAKDDQLNEFISKVRNNKFTWGDKFWMGNYQFEVVLDVTTFTKKEK